MNENYQKAMELTGRAKAILYAIEEIAQGIDVEADCYDDKVMLTDLIYAAEETVDNIDKRMNDLAGDLKILNIMEAAQKMRSTLKDA